jgi:heme exporter protein A
MLRIADLPGASGRPAKSRRGCMITSLHAEDLALQRGERMLFRRLELRVCAGEAVALTGANGAGKTSLLRAIAGFIRPSAGRITFEGATGSLVVEDARRAGCHLVGHQDGLKPGRRARDELLFQAHWHGGSTAGALAAADRLGLTRLLALEIRVLSAGQRRRLALARLIASPRPLWLLDEPLAPLDAASRTLLGAVMAEHLASGGLIVAAVHDPLPLPVRGLEIVA